MSPTAEAARLRAALAELVACEDLKDIADGFPAESLRDYARRHEAYYEYHRRQPLAWAEARAALSPIETTAGVPISDEQSAPASPAFDGAMQRLHPGYIRAYHNQFLQFARMGWDAALAASPVQKAEPTDDSFHPVLQTSKEKP